MFLFIYRSGKGFGQKFKFAIAARYNKTYYLQIWLSQLPWSLISECSYRWKMGRWTLCVLFRRLILIRNTFTLWGLLNKLFFLLYIQIFVIKPHSAMLNYID